MDMKLRLQMLKELNVINKKLGFVGGRGVEMLDEKGLGELLIKLKKELKNG